MAFCYFFFTLLNLLKVSLKIFSPQDCRAMTVNKIHLHTDSKQHIYLNREHSDPNQIFIRFLEF